MNLFFLPVVAIGVAERVCMESLSWVKDLVRVEQEMEESGVVVASTGFNPEKQLYTETTLFLRSLKSLFVDATTAFNQMKTSPMGRLKVYNISQTQSDFMIFRGGFKLIFGMKRPGTVVIRFNRAVGLNLNADSPSSEEELLTAKWGPFGDLVWTYNGQPIKKDYLVKYYMTCFVHESAQ